MKTIKYIFTFLIVITFSQFAKAQEQEKIFQDFFEMQNVGNLHLYIAQSTLEKDDFLYGQTIPRSFNNMFPLDLRERLIPANAPQTKAIFAVRGEDLKNYYIIQVPNKKEQFELVMYELWEGKLYPRKTLASYECGGTICKQIDSWIIDVNGDTRLDIIQKTKVVTKKDTEIITEIYLLHDDGQYQLTRKIDITAEAYAMQSL